ncbi:MAG: DUF1308 domain-containing protein [Cyanobacteria bacterium P01_G01_bin.19]
MLNLDTGTAIAFIAEGSTQRRLLREYIGDCKMVITATAVEEFRKIVNTIAGERERARAYLLLQKVDIIDDDPSPRALKLKVTRKLGENDIIIMGTGDKLGIITITCDSKAVRAATAQGVEFNTYVHLPYSLQSL